MSLRFGFVEEVAKPLVKVNFPGADGDMPLWLQLLAQWTEDDQDWNPPAKGEHVACLLDENAESGVIMGSPWSDLKAPPSDSLSVWMKRFKDGTTLTYDKDAKKLSVIHADGTTVEVTGSEVKVDGDLVVTGKVTAGGDVQSSGNISTALGEVSAGPINLKSHPHLGNMGAPTSPPLPG